MQLLLATGRKTVTSRWICLSCRGVKHLSRPTHDLRNIGKARTRFAPSPTGYLHLGSLRTALFNYLVAKATGGEFLLRIEDTDQKRTVPDAETRLLRDLEWAGIEWDEGPRIGGPYGPYKQSERTALYREHTERLLETEKAYRCFCTPERLHSLANYRSSLGLPPDYDRKCAHIQKSESDDRAAKGEAHVVRLKSPEKYPPFQDLVYGLVKRKPEIVLGPAAKAKADALGSYEDPILMKTDGFPTYHLANVVDDHHMEITHVIRGSEWMPSTPKHLALYEAFGWQPPNFAHVGLLLDKDRNKLSKRNGTIDIEHFRNQGVFPETLTNFVALLGWSHNEGQDIMSMEDLTQNASMKYTRGDSIVGFEKLWFLQRKHAARYASMPPRYPINQLHSLDEIAVKPMVEQLEERFPFDQSGSQKSLRIFKREYPNGSKEEYVRSILQIDAQNYTTPKEFLNRNVYFFFRPSVKILLQSVPSLTLRHVPPQINHKAPTKMLASFESILELPSTEWTMEKLKELTNFIIERGVVSSIASAKMENTLNLELRKQVQKSWSKVVHGYLRWAIFAGSQGPDGAETMRIIGKDETKRRLRNAEKLMRTHLELRGAKEEKAESTDEAVSPVVESHKKASEVDGKQIREWSTEELEDGFGELTDDDFI